MGAQHLRIPYGLLRQLCYAGGTRLAPLVSKVRPPELELDAEHIPWTSSATTAPSIGRGGPIVVNPTAMTVIDGQDHLGNLSNEAYKFFRGSMIPGSTMFQCRGCGMEEHLKERRLLHMRACRPLMQAIEERIKRDKVCVICNTGTSRERWQIPLCSEACVTKWRFVIPEPYLVAKRFVLASDPGLLKVRCESTQTNS